MSENFIAHFLLLSADLWLSSIFVLGQIDPGDGAKWSEELLEICLTSVLRQIGYTDGGIVISCWVETYIIVENTTVQLLKCQQITDLEGTPIYTHPCGLAA